MKTSLHMVAILLLAFLTIAAIDFGICNGSHDVVCPQREKQALSSFKQDLKDPSDRLSSWKVDEDCCKWAGVVCDNLTGHVLVLHLRNPPYYYPDSSLGGEINPFLLNLKHLNYLDLSGNDFQGISIPSFIGSLATLQYLNLSDARFEGTIPHQLGNLSGLRFLSLKGGMHVENLQWLLGLSHLEHLDLGGVNLTSEHNWLQVINNLPSLVELHLSDCQLDHIPQLTGVNFTSLAILDLSKNDFRSLIPRWIFSLSSLVFLDLGSNMFHCPFPMVQSNMTLLRYLDLSWNDLNCTVPSWLYSFSRLEFLDLHFNHLQGEISNKIGNLSCLISLKISHNNLGGRLPNAIANLASLNTLDLSVNGLVGRLPNAIGNLASLDTLTYQVMNLRDGCRAGWEGFVT
ncbi:LRR receptor-like serine/threonine-protein kinase IRK precursor [Actinidia chinensis var. chinensis]|uniref:LRR receptor-like serine/threonine-protein kinase IRK n=1 Tax=Actinidia chinensis var. chinensis TaxID=1590841 RepID=A0A2R6RTA9_ACTCC|nr:LRR receptor-like serine/threonine-protein kinase IRK precursor [Actinidia chinensis var. chinensis]